MLTVGALQRMMEEPSSGTGKPLNKVSLWPKAILALCMGKAEVFLKAMLKLLFGTRRQLIKVILQDSIT